MEMIASTPLPATHSAATGPVRFWSRALARVLGQAAAGSLLVEHDGRPVLRREGRMPGPAAHVRLHRWKAAWRALLGGEHGAAEAFLRGEWSSPDLVETCRYFARNPAGPGWSALALGQRWLGRLRHAANANTRAGSRRNIRFHYDLGNEFYGHWLDGGMNYSSALWREPGESLEQAQRNKLERVVEMAGLVEGRDVLEIGCGWGAQACTLARHGARVKGITLSREQLQHARSVVLAEGVADRVALALEDYRDQRGKFDAIVSIEMAEAVGESNLPEYFATIRRNLRPGGRAVIQVITIAEDRLDGYRREPDFIQRHVFPGGFLPSRTLFLEVAREAGLRAEHVESFGQSYAETLAHWRRRFEAAWPQIAPLGFDARFRRLWNYYLSYCEAGFREDCVDVNLIVLTRD